MNQKKKMIDLEWECLNIIKNKCKIVHSLEIAANIE